MGTETEEKEGEVTAITTAEAIGDDRVHHMEDHGQGT